MQNVPAREFMETEPVSVQMDTPLAEVVRLFFRHRVRALPVVDSDGRLVGVVSERDLFPRKKGIPFSLEKMVTLLGQPVDKQQLTQHESAASTTVAETMSSNPVTITPETTIEDASMHMLDRRLSVLPVVEGNRLVGMVRRINLLQGIYGDRFHED